MRFWVVQRQSDVARIPDSAFLVRINWDDYGFKTTFELYYRDQDYVLRNIGRVKIGQFGMGRSSDLRLWIPEEFEALDSSYFSLGQDDEYYLALNELGSETRSVILNSLRDSALDSEQFDRALNEEVMGKSLLRFVTVSTARNQFHRMSQGGTRLTAYSFIYRYPLTSRLPGARESTEERDPPLELDFGVTPGSQPPTNVHVIIGRNGVGKSRLLNNMVSSLIDNKSDNDEAGSIIFNSDAEETEADSQFANLVSVAFSAFDDFEPLSTSINKSHGLQYAYIGLKKVARNDVGEPSAPKGVKALATDFGNSVKVCIQRPKLSRWRQALEILESDPIFADVQVAELADSASDDDALRARARNLFRDLSSGHKIVLLTITRLVETVEEKSLVLLDEPESHLHPPLLSAFVRTLSNLLIDRNGVAIIATHSPVILQEVPKTCVWKLRRSGGEVAADRLELETFGENVGTLTQEVFGLEVTNSGFHRMIAEAVMEYDSYREVIARFGNSLGSEARALIQGLIAAREAERDN